MFRQEKALVGFVKIASPRPPWKHRSDHGHPVTHRLQRCARKRVPIRIEQQQIHRAIKWLHLLHPSQPMYPVPQSATSLPGPGAGPVPARHRRLQNGHLAAAHDPRGHFQERSKTLAGNQPTRVIQSLVRSSGRCSACRANLGYLGQTGTAPAADTLPYGLFMASAGRIASASRRMKSEGKVITANCRHARR